MGYLVYDADCAFCTSCARWIETRGVEVRAWQGMDDLASLGLTEAMVSEAAYWVEPGRAPLEGSLAVARGLEVSGGWRRPVGRVIRSRPVQPVAAPAYRWVARHRHLMPGATAACRMP